MWTYGMVGRRAILWFIPIISLYFFLVHREARKASFSYLRRLRAFAVARGVDSPAPTAVNVFRHFNAFARAVVDKVSVWSGSATCTSVTTDTTELRKVLEAKRGAILLSAHIGNVEVMRAVGEQLGEAVVTALMFTKNSERFVKLLTEINPNSHVRIVPIDSISVSTAVDLEERVSKGECIAILGDRLSPTAPDRAVRVSFLGEQASFPEGPFILSSLMNCPVCFCSALAKGDTYDIKITKFSDRVVLPRATRKAALEVVVRQYAEHLEAVCLEHPFQWFNFFEFWERG